MIKKVLLIALLATLFYFGYKYWPVIWGLYRANAPTRNGIVELIPEVGKNLEPGQNNTALPLKMPDGYSISIYAKDLQDPRDLVMDPSNVLLASVPGQGKVVAIISGKADTVAGGLDRPHGIAFSGNKLYIAETDGVSVFDYDPKLNKAINKIKIIDLPGGGRHFTRSLLIRDNRLYVSIGSSCDTCEEKDDRRASIWSSNLDGSDFKPFATGLRNSVFMTLNPSTNEIWATEMGRDNLGDDIPPDEVNIIKEGQFYGWPYCWGDGSPDKDLNVNGTKFDCSKSILPEYKLQAHSAPLGLAFVGQDLLVAYHGSWNRKAPTGYKIVRLKNGVEEDYITGWLRDNGEVLGRPVDILVKGNGEEIYISDDKAGVIYLVKKI